MASAEEALEMMAQAEQEAEQLALQPECRPHYAHDRQAVWAHPYPRKHWCEDHKARLRWRVAPHPLHGRCFVLRPCAGLLHLNPNNDAGTYVVPGHVATLQVY